MNKSGFKFDIEEIADKMVGHIEDLMTEAPIITNDFDALRRGFQKVIELQKELGTKSIDMVIVWEPKKWDSEFNIEMYKLEVAEIFNRINFKLTESPKISTFFRGTEKQAPAFHFPSSLNIWFLTVDQFIKSEVTPLAIFNLGISELNNFFTETRYPKKLLDKMQYYFVEVNKYFSYEDHVEEAWSKK